MIEKKELEELAGLNGLRPWQQEKHYIQAVTLGILADQPLVFKGGTYLWFFHGLPRFSEDLDFTAKEKLREDIAGHVSRSLELVGIRNSHKTITDNGTTLSFRVSAKGPLNTRSIDECRVYVEISKREQAEKKAVPMKLDFPAYNIPTKRVPGMALEEVAAEKARAIMTRDKARDIFDLGYLIEKKNVAFSKGLIQKKLAFYSMKFSEKEFLEKAMQKEKNYEKELKGMVFAELGGFGKTMHVIKKWAGAEKQFPAI